MNTRRYSTIFAVIVVAAGVAFRCVTEPPAFCRTIPGDAGWPTTSEWDAFNGTVNGKLISTVPIAAPCHSSFSGGDGGNATVFDQSACDALRDNWFSATTHLPSSSSPMAYQFSNNSCNPFLGPEVPCTLGYHVSYTVNATSVEEIQTALQFAKDRNIRIVIRNSGHDYLGKSTGAYALAIWTQHLKSIELISEYSNPSTDYTGPALSVGAGIQGAEIYQFASDNNLMVVAGNCPNVGVTGGYIQGGGIGILSSKFGLAADQVLSYEVLTAAGDIITADATQNEDLFWALRGGGAGTFGIVLSMVVKAFPDTFFSTATLMLPNNGNNTDAIYNALGTFLQSLPSLVDAGAWVVWIAAPTAFMISPAMVAGLHPEELDALLQPTLDKMDSLGLQYEYASAEHEKFLEGYQSLGTVWNVSDFNAGGRLIPRELVEDDASTASLVSAIKSITATTFMSGVAFNVADAVSSPDEVAANPYFRKTLFSAAIGTPVNYTDWEANREAQQAITNELLPQLEAITPDGGVYLNEADFQDPNFQDTFYGGNYPRLLTIKEKYDPESIFYAVTAVGSESWEQRLDGRLCKK